MKAAYANDRQGPTTEEDRIIREDTLECEKWFQLWDQIRLEENCKACKAEVGRLGIFVARESCKRTLRATTGRPVGQKQ